jgi:hypothetical protein
MEVTALVRFRSSRATRARMRDTTKLREAFRDAMSRAGQPLQKILNAEEVYRTPKGLTVLLLTNRRRVLMTVAAGFSAEDIMAFEGHHDLIGIAVPGSSGSVECFLIPTNKAVDGLRSAHRTWVAEHPGSTAKTRAVHFDGDPRLAWEGFSMKWAQYRLDPPASLPSKESRLEEIIAYSRRAIAAEAGRPETAVHISITY